MLSNLSIMERKSTTSSLNSLRDTDDKNIWAELFASYFYYKYFYLKKFNIEKTPNVSTLKVST